MKKLLICLVTLMAAVSASAQEHLSFKGIPMEGSAVSFCQKLKAKGFTQIEKNNATTILKGDFTGREVTIGVQASDDGNKVLGIVVLVDSSKEWKYLTSLYDSYKVLYTRKYGEPELSKEYNPAISDSNIALMYELHQGTVVYASAWRVPGGEIELRIAAGDDVNEGTILIYYRDIQNIQAKKNKDLEDI